MLFRLFMGRAAGEAAGVVAQSVEAHLEEQTPAVEGQTAREEAALFELEAAGAEMEHPALPALEVPALPSSGTRRKLMAHFARIASNNQVMQVVVVPDEHEYRGGDYLSKDLGLGGDWIQTSYNARIRERFASVGGFYVPEKDMFTEPKIYDSWVYDEDGTCHPPIPKPEGDYWIWDESLVSWVNPVEAQDYDVED